MGKLKTTHHTLTICKYNKNKMAPPKKILITHNKVLSILDLKTNKISSLNFTINSNNIKHTTRYNNIYYVLTKTNIIYCIRTSLSSNNVVMKLNHQVTVLIDTIQMCVDKFCEPGAKLILITGDTLYYIKNIPINNHKFREYCPESSDVEIIKQFPQKNVSLSIIMSLCLYNNKFLQQHGMNIPIGFDTEINPFKLFQPGKFFCGNTMWCEKYDFILILLNDEQLYLFNNGLYNKNVFKSITNDELIKYYNINGTNDIYNIWILNDNKKNYIYFVQTMNGHIHVVNFETKTILNIIKFFNIDHNIEINIDNIRSNTFLITNRFFIYRYLLDTNILKLIVDGLDMDYCGDKLLNKVRLTKNIIKHCTASKQWSIQFIILCNKHTVYRKMPIDLIFMVLNNIYL